MTPERSSDATITTVDLSVASSDHSFVGLSTYMAMVLAGWQAMLLPYLMTLPALVGLICGATALLVSHTPTKLRFALVAQLSVLPGAMLLIMLLVGSLINLSAHLDPFGLANTETLRSIISSFGTTDTAGLAVSGALPLCTIFFFVPSFWRLARGAYPPTTKLALRSAFRAQTSAVRQHKRFSLWCIPVLLSVPLLLALSFLLHVIVRPFGGPFMNALSLAPQYPVSWIKDFMRFHKQRTQLGVKEALAYDKRAPILLLRSFDDDHIAYAPWELQERSPRLASLNTLRFVLEEALAMELSRKGPPIAIGAPGEVLPPIGAYRQYCGEAEWQSVVLERMSEAQSIVVIASETRWLSWELEQIAKNNYVEKCMLFFPPLEPFAHADRVTAVSRAISSFLPPAASTAITAPGLVALLFGSSNSITALFDKTQSKESYILAVQAGLPVT